MDKDNTPLWLERLNWNNQYLLNINLTNSPKDRICYYLVHSINPATNNFTFSIKSLSNRFSCTRSTVFSALRLLRSLKTLRISQHHIHFRHYKGWKGSDLE